MKKIFLFIYLIISSYCFSQTRGVIMDANNQAYISNIPAISTLFSQISTVTINGYTTGTDYSIKGTIVGNDTIQPSSFYVGKTWIGFQNGNYSTPLVTVGSLIVKVKLGSTTILTNTVTNLPVNVSTLAYTSHVEFTCRATGSSGSIAASGYVEFSAGTSLTTLKLFFTPTVTPIDLSTYKIYDATVQYSATGNTLTSMTHSLISLN